MFYTTDDFGKPQNCNACYLSTGYGCGASGNIMTTAEMKSEELPKFCPLIPVVPIEVLEEIKREILDLDDDIEYDYEGYYKAITDVAKIIDRKIKEYK